jgi:ABC-type phosphate transport system auxiliary subunit
MTSRLSSNTEMPVPSNSTRVGSFCDLNLKNTDEDMMGESFDAYVMFWVEDRVT